MHDHIQTNIVATVDPCLHALIRLESIKQKHQKATWPTVALAQFQLKIKAIPKMSE